ncbi:hypothetical protein D3P08_05905 [Paenibacillus nanensis]|uniref:DUF4185 domain-containing protein n=1 Tax=Paenibacillus nanensis TaxID=393251 RepID=A0A3A1VH76_9BACL|nr:hypothetical protein [Paenibacillus nanensis]RIX59664.1 hypothetical protein D3P08_05905 [Paenibacillus nanensis]
MVEKSERIPEGQEQTDTDLYYTAANARLWLWRGLRRSASRIGRHGVIWDGSGWSVDKEEVQPIADEISCEYCVTPMGGQWDGAGYAVVFHESGAGNRLSMYIGDSPVGPFRNPIRLYACPEPLQGKTIYAYSAKAHPHLSARGELLSSYNVNATSKNSHMEHGCIYRPRFVNIRQIRLR